MQEDLGRDDTFVLADYFDCIGGTSTGAIIATCLSLGIRVGNNSFTFVDGGVMMYNNPAFQLFLMATVEPYALQWPTGEDKMLLVSIGTGSAASANANLAPNEMNLIYNASSIPSALMYAASNEQNFLCRIFGQCWHADELDREVGNLCDVKGPTDKKLFSYVRYNADLSRRGLDDLGLLQIKPEYVQQMDSVQYIDDLQKVGKAVAKKVEKKHFVGFVK